MYTDPSGEIILEAILIGAAIFGVGNWVASGFSTNANGKVIWKANWNMAGLQAFGQGALVGAALGALYASPAILEFAGVSSKFLLGTANVLQTGMTIYGYTQAGLGIAGMIGGAVNSDGQGFNKAAKLFFGNFYLDENSFWGGVGQGISRHTWEFLQTGIGHGVSQVFNTAGITDKVEYYGGATFSTTRDDRIAVSIGNFINVRTKEYTNFADYILTDYDVMHEYGHTFDSRIFGLSYLFVIGAPSLFTAWYANKTKNSDYHRNRWYERSANKHAKKYFGVPWDELKYPIKKR